MMRSTKGVKEIIKAQLCYILILFTGLAFIACEHAPLTKDKTSQEGKWADALDYARKHLPKQGILVQKADGYAYVKVDDEYIHAVFPLLHAKSGFKKPPYFRRSDAPGAHISVANENEHVVFSETGQTFRFTLDAIKIIDVSKDISYIIMEVAAPELENLRRRYGLSPKLQGHEFHITLAKKVEQ